MPETISVHRDLLLIDEESNCASVWYTVAENPSRVLRRAQGARWEIANKSHLIHVKKWLEKLGLSYLTETAPEDGDDKVDPAWRDWSDKERKLDEWVLRKRKELGQKVSGQKAAENLNSDYWCVLLRRLIVSDQIRVTNELPEILEIDLNLC